jgi:hypothetical protein
VNIKEENGEVAGSREKNGKASDTGFSSGLKITEALRLVSCQHFSESSNHFI